MPQLACSDFATVTEVLEADCACELTLADDGDEIAELIGDASDMLYVLSGGRVFGQCTRQVWPVSIGARCGPGADLRSSWVDWDSLDSIPLQGPNTNVIEVTIDGVALNPSEYGLLDGYKLFRRVGSWPSHNDLTLTDADEGTFTITYSFGRAPTGITRRATVALVCQMIREEPRALSRLRGVVSANVQGVSVELDDDEIGRIGLPELTRFMDTYSPRGIGVLGVYSPELNHGWRLVSVSGPSGS